MKQKAIDSLLTRKRGTLLLGVIAGMGILLIILRISLTASRGFLGDHISGSWMALAQDLREGIFYRPLFSPEHGFGGSRYFPLYFVSLACFVSLFKNMMLAAAALSIISYGLLVGGLFRVLREFSLERSISLVLALLPLLTLGAHSAAVDIRCDVLCAGLNVWGLY